MPGDSPAAALVLIEDTFRAHSSKREIPNTSLAKKPSSREAAFNATASSSLAKSPRHAADFSEEMTILSLAASGQCDIRYHCHFERSLRSEKSLTPHLPNSLQVKNSSCPSLRLRQGGRLSAPASYLVIQLTSNMSASTIAADTMTTTMIIATFRS